MAVTEKEGVNEEGTLFEKVFTRATAITSPGNGSLEQFKWYMGSVCLFRRAPVAHVNHTCRQGGRLHQRQVDALAGRQHLLSAPSERG